MINYLTPNEITTILDDRERIGLGSAVNLTCNPLIHGEHLLIMHMDTYFLRMFIRGQEPNTPVKVCLDDNHNFIVML